METLIVTPASRSKMKALKAFLSALDIDFKTSSDDADNVIKNPETLRRIEEYELGKSTIEYHTLDEIKGMANA